MKDKITDIQIDLLNDILNIGGKSAAMSISKLFKSPIKMDGPCIEFLNYKDLYTNIMNEEETVEAVLIKVYGQGQGVFLYVLEEKDALNILKKLLPDNIELNENLKKSAIEELANILVNSFISGTSKILDIELYSSVPYISIDMFGAVLSSVYIETGQCDSDIMIIKNSFSLNGKQIKSSLYFVPEPGLLEKLFNKLGI